MLNLRTHIFRGNREHVSCLLPAADRSNGFCFRRSPSRAQLSHHVRTLHMGRSIEVDSTLKFNGDMTVSPSSSFNLKGSFMPSHPTSNPQDGVQQVLWHSCHPFDLTMLYAIDCLAGARIAHRSKPAFLSARQSREQGWHVSRVQRPYCRHRGQGE